MILERDMSDSAPQLTILDAPPLNVDAAVRRRYSAASQQREPALCCPVSYDQQYLAAIPAEVLERDYGCGDPSKHVRSGDTVLDLGSGGGKICFIAAQVVGPAGRVIGVDCNRDMLDLARRSRPLVAEKLGFNNVEFRRGRIQDLRLDLDRLDEMLQRDPPTGADDWLALQERIDELAVRSPLIPDESIDVVVSNCVLNLVRQEDRNRLFAELFRVLKPGGRAVISDIVADRDVPESLRNDPELWSGCISGAFREDRFIEAFLTAGFHGAEILEWQPEPWTVVEGIEFRSVTVRAWKAQTRDASSSATHALYHGPWAEVIDDAGRRLIRGQRIPIDAATASALDQSPYRGHVTLIGHGDAVTEATSSCCGPTSTDDSCCEVSPGRGGGM